MALLGSVLHKGLDQCTFNVFSNANALFPAGCFGSPELRFWHSRVAFCMVSSENKRQ